MSSIGHNGFYKICMFWFWYSHLRTPIFEWHLWLFLKYTFFLLTNGAWVFHCVRPPSTNFTFSGLAHTPSRLITLFKSKGVNQYIFLVNLIPLSFSDQSNVQYKTTNCTLSAYHSACPRKWLKWRRKILTLDNIQWTSSA